MNLLHKFYTLIQNAKDVALSCRMKILVRFAARLQAFAAVALSGITSIAQAAKVKLSDVNNRLYISDMLMCPLNLKRPRLYKTSAAASMMRASTWVSAAVSMIVPERIRCPGKSHFFALFRTSSSARGFRAVWAIPKQLGIYWRDKAKCYAGRAAYARQRQRVFFRAAITVIVKNLRRCIVNSRIFQRSRAGLKRAPQNRLVGHLATVARNAAKLIGGTTKRAALRLDKLNISLYGIAHALAAEKLRLRLPQLFIAIKGSFGTADPLTVRSRIRNRIAMALSKPSEAAISKAQAAWLLRWRDHFSQTSLSAAADKTQAVAKRVAGFTATATLTASKRKKWEYPVQIGSTLYITQVYSAEQDGDTLYIT